MSFSSINRLHAEISAMSSHADAEYTCALPPAEGYDAEYEWPGEPEEGEIVNPSSCSTPGPSEYLAGKSGDEPHKGTTSTSFLRLAVLQSTCLPSKRRLAILTGYPEIQFGRDRPAAGSVVPRIRLKEMEVSKFHATVYWDGARQEWGIVDMGSMHGTFVHGGDCSGSNLTRLSQPRVASLPRPLHHLDTLSIGSTVFCVHIHEDNLACADCASSAVNEIPLLSTDNGKPVAGVTNSMTPPASVQSKDPKKSLAMLKQNLLRQHTSSSNSGPLKSSSYVDRAARRREMHGTLSEGAPGTWGSQQTQSLSMEAAPTSGRSASTSVRSSNQSSIGPPKELVSDPPAPLPESNIGHRLLSKMGWEPGTGLGIISPDGDEVGGIVNPIEVNHHDKRAGLGTKRPAASLEESWREGERQKRYASLRATLYEGR